jgi:hypothetical protein
MFSELFREISGLFGASMIKRILDPNLILRIRWV